MRTVTRRTLAASGAALSFYALVASVAIGQSAVENKRYGFKVKAPSSWTEVPLKVDERWIVAKYLSDRELYDRESNWTHRPEMTVIVFPADQTRPQKPKKIETAATGEEKKTVVVINFQHPYKNYLDYLDRNYSGGGFYVSAEKEDEIGGISVTMREISVEKSTFQQKKMIAWVFHLEDLDVAVQFEVLMSQFDKLKPGLVSCLRSFREVPREGLSAEEAALEAKGKEMRESDVERTVRSIADEDNLSPDELKKRRIEIQEYQHKKAIARLPSGWTSKRTPHFLVLSHVDDRFRDKVIGHAEAVRSWLDKTFADLGEDYVPHGIIRICASSDEERAYHSGSGDAFSYLTGEVTISKDYTFRDFEFEWLGRGLADQWLSGKNNRLAWSMPAWLENGISQYVGSAAEKGGRLVFPADAWEKRGLKIAERSNELASVKDMFWSTDRSGWSMARYYQSASIVRFLLGPDARRSSRTKGLLTHYLKTFDAVVRERAKEEAKESKKLEESKTEAEEEERFKQRKSRWEADSKAILEEVHRRVFSGWTDSDWDSLDKAWRGSVL